MKKIVIFFTLICGLFAEGQSRISNSNSPIFTPKSDSAKGCEVKIDDDIFSGNTTCQIETNGTKLDTNSTKK